MNSIDPSRNSTYRAGPATLSDPEKLSPRLRRRRALALVALTLVLPGSAQVVGGGNRAVGRAALRIWLGVLGVVALLGVLLFVRRGWALSLVTTSWFLTLTAATLMALAVMWFLLFVDTLRLARLRGLSIGTRRLTAALTVVGILVTTVPLVVGARYVGAARDLFTSVFAGEVAQEAVGGRYNILILGGDSGASRIGTRPDSISVASIDAETGRTVLFGFSRDTEHITFRPGSVMAGLMPEGWMCGDECLLNGLYTWAEDHRKQFPAGTREPGILATKEAVEALSGLDIQYYALADLRGFAGLINALGGLEINVLQRTPYGGTYSKPTGYIEVGRQVLDGYHALWYARSRTGTSDYDRMARQRCVMQALLQQMSPTRVVLKFQAVAEAGRGVLKTDMPASELGTLAELAIKAKSQKVRSLNFVPPLINPWSYDPQKVKDTVAKAIADSMAAPTPRPTSTGKPSKPSTSTGGATPSATPSAAPGSDTADLESVCAL